MDYKFLASLEAMNQQGKSQQSCDVVIVVNNQELWAHRSILAANSPFFAATFCKTPAEGQITVTLNSTNAAALDQLIAFMYTKKLCISFQNVEHLLLTAVRLMLENVVKRCCEFMENTWGPEILAIGGMDESKSKQLPLVERFDVGAERWSSLPDLPHSLNGYSMNPAATSLLYMFTRTSKNRPAAKAFESCSQYLSDNIFPYPSTNAEYSYRKFIIVAEEDRALYAINGHHDTIWMSDGKASSHINVDRLQRYDMRTDVLENLTAMNIERCCMGVGVINKQIFCCGGLASDLQVVNSAECYNLKTKCWKTVAAMLEPRHSFSCVEFKGCLYAIGGLAACRTGALKSCERFDPRTGTWTSIAPMKQARCAVGLVVWNGLLYAVGGNDENGVMLRSHEKYDLELNTWTESDSPKEDPKQVVRTMVSFLSTFQLQ